MGDLVDCRPLPLDVAAREKLMEFHRELTKLPQVDCPIQHFFAPGLYVRQIWIPAGVACTGYIHVQSCITTLSRGVIAVSDGEITRELQAPYTFVCRPGTMKAVLVSEEVVWADSYTNTDNETNIEKLEARLFAKSHEEFLAKFTEVA